MAKWPKRGRTRWQKSWGSKRGVSPRVGQHCTGARLALQEVACKAWRRQTRVTVAAHVAWPRASPKSEEETYVVLQSTMGPGGDDAELAISGGHARLGCRSRDRSLTPQPCQQRLGDERREPDQSALFDAEADRYLQRYEPQGGLDDPPQRIRVWWQVLARGHAARQGRHHVRDHGQ